MTAEYNVSTLWPGSYAGDGGGGDDDDGGGASRVVVVGVRKKLSRLDFWWWTSTPTGQGHVWQLGCHHIFSILMTLDI